MNLRSLYYLSCFLAILCFVVSMVSPGNQISGLTFGFIFLIAAVVFLGLGPKDKPKTAPKNKKPIKKLKKVEKKFKGPIQNWKDRRGE